MASLINSFITHPFVYSSTHVFNKCVLSTISEPDLERLGRMEELHACPLTADVLPEDMGNEPENK